MVFDAVGLYFIFPFFSININKVFQGTLTQITIIIQIANGTRYEAQVRPLGKGTPHLAFDCVYFMNAAVNGNDLI